MNTKRVFLLFVLRREHQSSGIYRPEHSASIRKWKTGSAGQGISKPDGCYRCFDTLAGSEPRVEKTGGLADEIHILSCK